MADQHHDVDVDPAQLAHASELWGNFVRLSKWGIIAIALSLVGMAVFLV